MTPDIDVELRQRDLVRLALTVTGAAEWFALRLTAPLRLLALSALASAAWLAYWAASLLQTGAGWALALLLLFGLPAYLLTISYWLLRRVIGLPRRIANLAESLYGIGHSAYRDLGNGLAGLRAGTRSARLRELWRMAKMLRHLRKAPGDAAKLMAATGRAVLVINPVFMIGTGVSALTSLLLLALAVVTLIARCW